MDKGKVQVYYGTGQGKTSAALGNVIRSAAEGKSAVVIQFMKEAADIEFLKRLEPEVRLFRFERSEEAFESLTKEEQEEEKQNIENGLNFAKKVLTTDNCDILVLDEILGLVENGVVSEEELIQIFGARSIFTSIILTGRTLPDSIRDAADEVLNIVCEKPVEAQEFTFPCVDKLKYSIYNGFVLIFMMNEIKEHIYGRGCADHKQQIGCRRGRRRSVEGRSAERQSHCNDCSWERKEYFRNCHLTRDGALSEEVILKRIGAAHQQMGRFFGIEGYASGKDFDE